MNYLLNLFLNGDQFIKLSGQRPDGIQIVELRSPDGVYSSVGMYPNHRTWARVPA